MADISTLYIKVDSNGVVTASKNLKDLDQQANRVATTTDKVTKSTNALNTANNSSALSLNKMSSGFKTVGRDVQRYGLLMAAAAAAVTKFGFDLSSGLGQVQTLIPGTGDRIYELEQSLKDLSISSGKAFGDLTEGLYQTISAFQDTADTEEIFTQATEAAIAGGASVANSIELASAVTKAFGDTTAEATGKVFDLAFETVRLGQTTFPQLANGIQQATDSAVRLGVSQEELFATFSALTGVIGDASEVATKFRSASASLLNPNEALVGLFGRLAAQTGETIVTGKDFVRVAGGWQEALALIVKTAEDSNTPLQKYIRRIEGITLASRLASNSAEKYREDLLAANNALGAAARSYEEVKEGIDEFRQSILESRQQIAVAASDIAENLIPRLAELFQQIANVITYISQLDSGIQNAIITIGGLVIVLGPALIALGSLLRAFQLIQALNVAGTVGTIVAAIGGPVGLIAILAVAATAFIAGSVAINKYTESMKAQKEEIARGQGLIASFSKLAKAYEITGEESEVNIGLNKELVEQYPELADAVDVYSDNLGKIYATLIAINKEKFSAVFEDQLEDLSTKAVRSSAALNELNEQIALAEKGDLSRISEGFINPADIGFLPGELERLGEAGIEELLESYKKAAKNSETEFKEIFTELSELAAKESLKVEVDVETGEVTLSALKTLSEAIAETVDDATDPPSLGGEGDKLKTWQEWFSEIAGVAKDKFGDSGEKAGEEFRKKLQDALNIDVISASIFEEDIDFTTILEDQLDQAKDVFKELASLKAEAIENGEIFQVAGLNAEETDKSMQSLKNTIAELTEQFDKASEIEIYTTLDRTTESITKQARAFPTLISEEERQEQILSALQTAYKDLTEQGIDTADASYKNLADTIAIMESSLEEQGNSVYGLKELWEDYKVTLRDLGISAVADSFYEIGRAIGDSTSDLEDFGDAMAGVLKGILDTLPALFIQAGLQAIVAGNVPLGLGLIAAGLAGNVVAGLVQGTIEEGENRADATESNAHGAVYSYAKGGALGSFENSIVNTPTHFNNGAGLMGEAGAEAIMPLTRTSDGNLGVAAVSSSSDVKVTIINNTGESVTQRETTGANGSKELEVIIGKAVNNALTNGTTDKAMRASYGVKRVGRN